MRRPLLLALCLLAVPASAQQPGPAEAEPARGGHPGGILSHGDAGDFLEDAYGGRAEPAPPAAALPGRAGIIRQEGRTDRPAGSR